MSKQQLNKDAGLYLRLSKDDERAGESLSIENQRRILEKYALDNGFNVVDTYIDDGWSGTSFQRPEVQRLLEDAKNGRINVIIVKDLSRFGRNYIEVGQYTDYIFPMYNVRFIAISDNVDSANSESSGMDMMPIYVGDFPFHFLGAAYALLRQQKLHNPQHLTVLDKAVDIEKAGAPLTHGKMPFNHIKAVVHPQPFAHKRYVQAVILIKNLLFQNFTLGHLF